MKTPKVYILILNWNGCKNTVECLESVFRLNYQNYKVIVCDNNSNDQSLEMIKQWTDGHQSIELSDTEIIREHTFPFINKPVKYTEYVRAEAEIGGNIRIEEPALILIQSGDNLGFAGENNVGLRYALARSQVS